MGKDRFTLSTMKSLKMVYSKWPTRRSSFSRLEPTDDGFSWESDFQSPGKPTGLGR